MGFLLLKIDFLKLSVDLQKLLRSVIYTTDKDTILFIWIPATIKVIILVSYCLWEEPKNGEHKEEKNTPFVLTITTATETDKDMMTKYPQITFLVTKLTFLNLKNIS